MNVSVTFALEGKSSSIPMRINTHSNPKDLIRLRIEEQKRKLHSLIVSGAPTQSIEDVLAGLLKTLHEKDPQGPR